MTDLGAAAHDYLTVRRRLGFELKHPGQTLENFLEFMDRAGAERVTTELALMWATSVQAHPHRWRRRLGVVRGFARYLSTIDPATEIPPEDLLPATLPRVAPYLYSPAEIQIGHESIKTTYIYQHADNQLKQQAIDRTATIGTPPGRYQPPDSLIAFLETL
jgi:hypothetical protein